MIFDNPVTRTKKWVRALLEHRDALEQAADAQIGELLGCGHWGCVLELVDSPYVLKLTIDPTEAPIWARIHVLTNDYGFGDGFPEVHRIFRLEPPVMYWGKARIAHGIVREKVSPAFGTRGTLTPSTLRYLGLSWESEKPPAFSYEALNHFDYSQLPRAQAVIGDVREFVRTVEALRLYRELAGEWHARHLHNRELLRDKIQSVIFRMEGWVGNALSESLSMLLQNDVVLRDTHLGNVGWRVDENMGPLGLVIFDPGHTPTREHPLLPVHQWRAEMC